MIDGIQDFVGASPCETMVVAYRDGLNARIAETGGLSPVAIMSDSEIAGNQMTVTATYRLVEEVTLNNLRATLLIYEDNVYWCCGYGGADTWQHTTRDLYDESITLENFNDEVTVEHTFTLGGDWDPAEMHAVAYLQNTATKEMVQAQKIGYGGAFDYSLWFDNRMDSVPDGNGMAIFMGTIVNLADQSDTITLEPGDAFGDWPVDFLVCGDDTPYSGPHDIVLGPEEMCEFTVRVHTDAAVEIRDGSFVVTSDATGRAQETDLQVYNGSYSIFFVDDDDGRGDHAPFINALDNLGVLYESYDVDALGASPSYGKMKDFDYVLWHHSFWFQPDPLLDTDVVNLMNYLDNGGSFYLASQAFLNDPLGPGEFITDYLGVASYTLDAEYIDVVGVEGDDIGDGLVLPLDYTIPSLAKGDVIQPGPNAIVNMRDTENQPVCLAHDLTDGGKSVFMAFPFNTISETDPDPNNTATVLQRVLDWLQPQVPANVDDGAVALLSSRIEGARPNPFNPRTEIAIRLSNAGAAGPVELAIYNLEGRRVANLVDGSMSAGRHTVTWTGVSDAGAPVESGVYFVRLTTVEGVRSDKLVLLK
ncbi:MAG: T9SS type A sorting domain-containing protein [Candidatus Latescibacteria bacterium]|nr:T9SS type A sorting domain-containing protein [Candidatus Latescibacterota bacterium]